MPQDLSHIQREIENNQVRAAEARRDAEAKRHFAEQRKDEDNERGGQYYDQEADRLEEAATALEIEAAKLQEEKERTEKRISELEAEKTKLQTEHEQKLLQITEELDRLRGSSLL
jgi:hypothetical protein